MLRPRRRRNSAQLLDLSAVKEEPDFYRGERNIVTLANGTESVVRVEMFLTQEGARKINALELKATNVLGAISGTPIELRKVSTNLQRGAELDVSHSAQSDTGVDAITCFIKAL